MRRGCVLGLINYDFINNSKNEVATNIVYTSYRFQKNLKVQNSLARRVTVNHEMATKNPHAVYTQC